jgi:hypothetical protein
MRKRTVSIITVVTGCVFITAAPPDWKADRAITVIQGGDRGRVFPYAGVEELEPRLIVEETVTINTDQGEYIATYPFAVRGNTD